MRIGLTVNGERRECDVWGESLLFALRERLGLPGSKNACEQGECGSCSVLLDGVLVCACLVLAAQADGHEVATVEGLADDGASTGCRRRSPTRAPSSAGSARLASSAAAALLDQTRSPRTTRSARRSPATLRRCTGYQKIFDAVRPRPHRCAVTRTKPLERGKVGETVRRADAVPKVTGEFAYSSDLQRAGMLWGHTVRSPHAHARIVEIDTGPALGMAGVHAVLTHEDVPGRRRTVWSSPTSPSWRSTACDTTASRSRSSRPSIPSRRGALRGDPRRVRTAAAGRRHGDRHGARAAPPRPADDGTRVPRRPAPERRPAHGDPARRPRRGGRRLGRRRLRGGEPGPGVLVPSRESRCRTGRAASTSTSRRSGSMSTATRWRRASA